MMSSPSPADPQIAAAVFADHVERARAGELARQHGWAFTRLGPLHVVVEVTPGRAAAGERFWVKLGAEYYDLYPPTTVFVSPPNPAQDISAPQAWSPAAPGSRWLPAVDPLPWFAIHGAYGFPDGPGQLVCCSMTFGYYVTGHSPTAGQRWRQGHHTLVATLSRIQDALDGPNYRGPSDAVHP
ncbi:hypothetical protein [Streptomyces sp. MK5]|uniref:hypothetical protein n=1 Tax=Streptomyces sp. MK5 TaxID=3064253 RepID=UPI0027429DB9|nr:hypothetical protein [Streptomyces sp. MK5]